MRDAGGARLRAPKRFLAPRQPQPLKVKLADQRDAPSPSQAEGAMPSGAILTKAGAILPQPDCNSRRGIAPNCTKLRSLRQKIKKEKTILNLEHRRFHYRVRSAGCRDGGGV